MKTISTLILAASALAGTAAPAKDGWEVIGTRSVGFGLDRDAVPVRGLERHRQIRLCAAGGAVHILDLDIRYANGDNQDVAVRSLVRAGTCTRDIDLVGRGRNISEVRILYERLRIRARPVIRVEAH